MNESKSKPEEQPTNNKFYQKIKKKAMRKIESRQQRKEIWFVLGMFGMVGWSVTIPTLIGLAIGIWIDTHISSPYSWTLMLLIIGLFLGCLTAWYWIEKEGNR